MVYAGEMGVLESIGIFFRVYFDGLWKHGRKPVLAATGSSFIGVLKLAVNANSPWPADLHIAVPWQIPAWVWFMIALVLLAYAQFRMWADEYHGRVTDKETAMSLAEVQRLALEATRIEMESKERDWSNERSSYRTSMARMEEEIKILKAPSPNIGIQWIGDVKDSHFRLLNRGDRDATDVRVSDLTSAFRQLQFTSIDLIKRGESSRPEVRSVLLDKDNQYLRLGPLSRERGNHTQAIMWLWGGDQAIRDVDSCADLETPYVGDLAISYGDENGVQQPPRSFSVTIMPVSWRVSILPKQPTPQSDPSTPPSPESTTDES